MVSIKDKILSKKTSFKIDGPKETNAKNQFAFRKPKVPTFLKKIGNYFKNSWIELRQVRWPDRKATWNMTGAVLLFTGFFVTLIVLLDAGFEQLFKLILK